MNKKLNILMIMADQLTPFMMGCYGNQEVITPNLDRLAQQSCVYSTVYSPNPLCAPARAAMMTGKYTSATSCFDNTSVLSSEEPTFAHALVNAGYETVLSGKMHFVGADQLHGFEKRLTTDIYPSDFAWLPEFVDAEKHIMHAPKAGNAVDYIQETARPVRWNSGLQYDEETHSKAREYLYREAARGEKPFFLCVSYHHPHDPFQPTRKYWDLYEGKHITIPDVSGCKVTGDTKLDEWLNTGFHRTDCYDVTSHENLYAVRRAYSALVTYIDDKVGELLEDLEQTGLAENTIVIFTSDHGDMLGERGMVQKRCFYEWSSRVPMMIRIPGEKPATVSRPVSLIDLSPTLIEMAGAEPLPETDAYSLLQDVEQRPPVFSESHGEGILWPCYMIRDGKYKYTYIHENNCQLFDMEQDPQEQNNLWGREEYRELCQELKQRILDKFSLQTVFHYVDHIVPQKEVIRSAMKKSHTSWDYVPVVDESRRFSR